MLPWKQNTFLSPTSYSLSRQVHCFFMVNLKLIRFIVLKIYLIKQKSVSLCPRLRYNFVSSIIYFEIWTCSTQLASYLDFHFNFLHKENIKVATLHATVSNWVSKQVIQVCQYHYGNIQQYLTYYSLPSDITVSLKVIVQSVAMYLPPFYCIIV